MHVLLTKISFERLFFSCKQKDLCQKHAMLKTKAGLVSSAKTSITEKWWVATPLFSAEIATDDKNDTLNCQKT